MDNNLFAQPGMSITPNQPGYTPGGNTNQITQGETLYNPADGQSYTVQNENPDSSIVVTNPNTQQPQVVSPQDRGKLLPQVKAWRAESLRFNDLQNYAEEGIVLLGAGGDINEWVEGVTGILFEEGIAASDVPSEVWNKWGTLTTSGGRTDLVLIWNEGTLDLGKLAMWRLRFGDASWLSDYLVNYKQQHTAFISVEAMAEELMKEVMHGGPDEKVAPNKTTPGQGFETQASIKDNNEKTNKSYKTSSFIKVIRAKNMSRNWLNTRKTLLSQQAKKEEAAIDPTRLSRQQQELRKRAIMDGRDPVSGVPTGEARDIEVGMTEFPYGEDKVKGKGYEDYTMEDLDKKNLEEREHFRNEMLLTLPQMRRKDLKEYINGTPDPFDRFDKEERYASIALFDEIGIVPKVSRLKELFKANMSMSIDQFAALDNATTIDEIDEVFPPSKTSGVESIYRHFIRTSADESTVEKPIQFKEIARAPGVDMGYKEPEAIQPTRGKAKEAITKMKQVKLQIEALQKELKEKTDHIKQTLKDAEKPIMERMTKEQALLKTYIDMVYEQLSQTEDKVGHYESEIYATIERENVATKPASVAELISKAEELLPEVAVEIKKIKGIIENERTTRVIEKYLYAYPIKGPQEKKIVSFDENTELEGLLNEFAAAAQSLERLNARF
jgi:hypothetical protein